MITQFLTALVTLWLPLPQRQGAMKEALALLLWARGPLKEAAFYPATTRPRDHETRLRKVKQVINKMPNPTQTLFEALILIERDHRPTFSAGEWRLILDKKNNFAPLLHFLRNLSTAADIDKLKIVLTESADPQQTYKRKRNTSHSK